MSKTKSTSLRTVKTGQAEIDRQLDEEYAKTAVAWWDVRRPEIYFGIKGERTDEQKELARRFRQEWSGGTGVGARGGSNALNSYIEGSVSADQLNSNWGSENLQALIKAGEFSSEAFEEGGNFGEYLSSQWENVSQFMGDTATGPDGSLGSLSSAPSQIAGEKGRLSADSYAQQAYLDNIRAAADQAGVPFYVDGPANSSYELNVGQYDDVPLGSYHTVREPDSIGEILFEAILKTIVISTLTGAVGAELQSLSETIGAAGELESLSTGLNIYETSDAANTVATVLDTIGAGLQGLNAASVSSGGATTGLTLSNVLQYAADIAPELSTTQGVLNGLDFVLDVYNSGATQAALDAAENAGAPDSVITEVPEEEEEVVSLEADPELMGEEKIMESEGLEPETVTGTSNRITDPVGSVGTAEDSFLNEDFISEAFENKRYSDATSEEIQAIVDSVEEEWGDSWDRLSDQSKELEITGRINDYVRDNTVNIKDLYRIFQAELGRRPTTEEINDILGGTKGTIKGTDDIVTEYIDSTLPVGETTVTETIGEEDFTTDPLPVPDTTPDAVKIQDVGFEVTEPAVNVEIDPYIPEQPTTDTTGGGAAEESAEAAAVTETTDAEAALEEAVAETGGVVTTQGGDAGQTSPVISDADEEVTTSDRPFWIIRDGVVYIRDIDNIDEWLPATNIPDWLPTEDGVYGQSGEQIDEDEEDILGTPTTIPSTSTEVVEEPDTTVVDVLTGNSTETVDELITDILTDTVVNQGTENVVVETNGTTTGGTDTGGTTTGGTDTGGTDTGDAEVGDAEVGDAEVGDGNENGDGDGDKDGDDSGDGVLGLGGSGLLSIESPSIFEPNYQPLSYDTELLKPRMFDFIDYNPLRTRR